jgi:hypothetical protein
MWLELLGSFCSILFGILAYIIQESYIREIEASKKKEETVTEQQQVTNVAQQEVTTCIQEGDPLIAKTITKWTSIQIEPAYFTGGPWAYILSFDDVYQLPLVLKLKFQVVYDEVKRFCIQRSLLYTCQMTTLFPLVDTVKLRKRLITTIFNHFRFIDDRSSYCLTS